MYDRTLRKFDSRIVQRNVSRKVVSKEDAKAFVDALEDCSHMAGESEVEFISSPKPEPTEADEKARR